MIYLSTLPQPWGTKEYGLLLLAVGAIQLIYGFINRGTEWRYLLPGNRPPQKLNFIFGTCCIVCGGALLLWAML